MDIMNSLDRSKYSAPGTYEIVSLSNPDRHYIGSSLNLYNRERQHYRHLSKGIHHAIKLQRHANKYGVDDLIFVPIEVVKDSSELIAKEQYLLDSQKPYFNSSKVAYSLAGRKFTKQQCAKQSRSARNRYGVTMPIENGFKVVSERVGDKTGRRLVLATCPVCGRNKEFPLQALRKRSRKNCGCIKTAAKAIPPIPRGYRKRSERLYERSDNTSGWVGVTYDKASDFWRARVKVSGKLLDAGRYTCPTTAVIGRDKFIISSGLASIRQIIGVGSSLTR